MLSTPPAVNCDSTGEMSAGKLVRDSCSALGLSCAKTPNSQEESRCSAGPLCCINSLDTVNCSYQF